MDGTAFAARSADSTGSLHNNIPNITYRCQTQSGKKLKYTYLPAVTAAVGEKKRQ